MKVLEKEPKDLISVFLSCHAAVFTFPYKMRYNFTLEKYEPVVSKFQKVLSGLLHLYFFVLQHKVYAEIFELALQTVGPTRYFLVARIVGDLCNNYFIFHTLYFKSQRFLDVTNMLYGMDSRLGKEYHKSSKWDQIIGTALFLGGVSLQVFPRILLIAEEQHWNLENFVNAGAFQGFRTFLFVTKNSDLSPWSKMFGVGVMICGRILLGIFWSYTDFLLIAVCISLNRVLNGFRELLNQKITEIEEILGYYYEMKEYFRKTSQALGQIFFAYCITMLPFFVSLIIELIQPNDIFESIGKFRIFSLLILVLLFCCMINVKGTELMEQLISNPTFMGKVSLKEYKLLIYDTATNSLSVSGLGLFKITPQFFGNILGLIITFGLILLQFSTACRICN